MGTVENKERSAYWDNIKGFLIILVVFAHVLYRLQNVSEGINLGVDFIYMFHMPAFVFVSGHFGKSRRSESLESIFKFVFLFFIFNSLTMFIDNRTNYLEPVYSYWYLLALIAWRLTAHHISRFRFITVLLFSAALLIGFFPAIDNHFAVARIIGFYPFYMLGYRLSVKQHYKLMDMDYSRRALFGVVLFLSTAAVSLGSILIFNYRTEELEMLPYNTPVDFIGRLAMFVVALIAIYAIRFITPDREIPFITCFGRNSLWIFVFHRLPALWIGDAIRAYPTLLITVIAVLSAFALCLAFGNDYLAKYFNKFLKSGAEIFTSDNKKITFAKAVALLTAIGFAVLAVFNSLNMLEKEDTPSAVSENQPDTDVIYPAMTVSQKECFDNAFRITFAGDLILLENQVNLGCKNGNYDYSDVFEYAKPYISSADLAIGVFEGPMAGSDKGYSISNYDDGKRLCLNFPDEFGTAVKNAGFDLVTTANNHLMDKGEDGAQRTLDVLDKIGLDHTGSYRNQSEKDNKRIKLVEAKGIRFAVLSYTYGSNYIPNSEFISGRYSYMTSVITDTSGETFEKLKSAVEEDFKAAKALNPDFIIVLPHIGTQFSNDVDETQKVWFSIFKENGADIILGDHPHSVEPALIETVNGKKVFTAYCPGNFANAYREHQGDTSMLIDCYIDPVTKTVIGGSVVPLYTYAPANANYKAVPIYEIMNNPAVRSELTVDDISRAASAHALIRKVVFSDRLDITSITERYYFNENGFIRTRNNGLTLTEELRNNRFYLAMSGSESVCFIGDSVTEGTKNGGCPWYEPVVSFFSEKTILNYSKGSCTVSYMLSHIDEIPVADLYVIALGTNDVRYRDDQKCAMTPEEFTKRLDVLKDKLLIKSPGCQFIFVAPWYSTDGDPFCKLSFEDKTALNNSYSESLRKYCEEKSFLFINANKYISDKLKTASVRTYLLDHIHPNASDGVILYSKAVLLSSKNS